jgi:iron(III) transport system ATP-binding protein
MSVQLENVSRAFGLTRAVEKVTLDVHPGELFGVLGPSGCGKTTLLRLIAGYERPDAGRITVGGKTMAADGIWVPPDRRRIGMVFQDYALFPHLTVKRNVAFGCGRGARQDVQRALELVGLQHKADRHPHELSGGERQRVALARALAPGPDVVLLDEPFSSLDATLRAGLRREVELILRDAGATAIIVTHDQEEALTLADRLALMRDGRIVQVGAPEDVYAQPAERWAAQFVGEVNVLPGMLRGDSVYTELGSFDLVCPAGGMAHGSVHIAVRPEQLEFRSGREPNAEVVEREFRGHDVLYRLRHQAGRTLLVQLPSLELYEPGQKVFVRPAEAARAPVVD